MQTQPVKTIGCSLASVAALCYLSLSGPECIYPLDLAPKTGKYEGQILPSNFANPYYSLLINEEQQIINQIEVLHQFVSIFLDRSQELNPEFSAVVDKHFWDLI